MGKNKYRKDKPESNEIGGIGVKRMGDGNGIKRWRGSHFSEYSFITVLTFKTNPEIKKRKEERNHWNDAEFKMEYKQMNPIVLKINDINALK